MAAVLQQTAGRADHGSDRNRISQERAGAGEALEYKDDEEFLEKLWQIKMDNKKALAACIQEKEGVSIDPESIFDIQIKRLHEYKRQQMNALYIIHKYLEIRRGKKPSTPITCIFGAKAAPAYVIAQDIIHLILVLQEIINNDPLVSPLSEGCDGGKL